MEATPDQGTHTGADRAAERALFERYRRDRDAATREELLARYMPLARHLARRYHGRSDLDDLNQVASMGLLKALDRFDPSHGTAFTSFAVPTITGELKRYFRDFGWAVRVPRDLKELTLRLERATEQLSRTLGRSPTVAELAAHTEETVERVLEALAVQNARYPDSLDQPLGDGEDAMERVGGRDDPGFGAARDTATVDALLDRLRERERTILELRYRQDLTQAEIGERLGLSQMHVSRLIRRSIATLQDSASAR